MAKTTTRMKTRTMKELMSQRAGEDPKSSNVDFAEFKISPYRRFDNLSVCNCFIAEYPVRGVAVTLYNL